MSELTIETLKKIIENVPDDYVVCVPRRDLVDSFEVDISNKKVTFNVK